MDNDQIMSKVPKSLKSAKLPSVNERLGILCITDLFNSFLEISSHTVVIWKSYYLVCSLRLMHTLVIFSISEAVKRAFRVL